jgi:hypothetical protein
MAVLTPVANPAGIAAVQDILKEVYVSDKLESQLLEEMQILEFFQDVTEFTDSDGLKASVPLRTGRTGGISARGIGEKLAPADHQKVGKATYNYKNLYLQVKVEGPVVARMQTNRQSVIREIDIEIDNGVEDMKFDMARQLHTFGDAVITVAALPGNASSTTIPLGASNYPVIERGWLYEGQPLDIGTSGSPQLDTGGNRIASITDSVSAPAVVLETATATTAGSHISLFGNRTAANGSNEINGLGVIVDDTRPLGGIDPTVAGKGYWKSVVEANGGTLRALSLALMNTTNRKIRQKGGKVTYVLGDLALQQKYYELLQTQVRFLKDTDLSAGKVQGPQFNEVTFQGDPHALPNRVYFLSKKALMMFSAGDIAWQNQTTGGDILAWSQDYDAFVARAAKYCQAGTNRRASFGVLKDITEA